MWKLDFLILGRYHIRFTKIEYIYKYQPVIVATASKYQVFLELTRCKHIVKTRDNTDGY
jgi:hypothetical protein